MRTKLSQDAEICRVTEGRMGSDSSYGMNGFFVFIGPYGMELRVMVSDGTDPIAECWEHVSVSTPNRIPNWGEMCFIKDIFWDDEECVLQFHPPKSKYINCHPRTLHLWKKIGADVELPPPILIG